MKDLAHADVDVETEQAHADMVRLVAARADMVRAYEATHGGGSWGGTAVPFAATRTLDFPAHHAVPNFFHQPARPVGNHLPKIFNPAK